MWRRDESFGGAIRGRFGTEGATESSLVALVGTVEEAKEACCTSDRDTVGCDLSFSQPPTGCQRSGSRFVMVTLTRSLVCVERSGSRVGCRSSVLASLRRTFEKDEGLREDAFPTFFQRLTVGSAGTPTVGSTVRKELVGISDFGLTKGWGDQVAGCWLYEFEPDIRKAGSEAAKPRRRKFLPIRLKSIISRPRDFRAVVGRFLRDGDVMWVILSYRCG